MCKKLILYENIEYRVAYGCKKIEKKSEFALCSKYVSGHLILNIMIQMYNGSAYIVCAVNTKQLCAMQGLLLYNSVKIFPDTLSYYVSQTSS